MEHVSISACADEFNVLEDSVNTAVLHKKDTESLLFDCKETSLEKETEKLSRYRVSAEPQ